MRYIAFRAMMTLEATMNNAFKTIMVWTPRSLGIMFAVFISLFSLDVLEMGAGFWVTLAGFLVHNIPTIILILALIIGWRWEWAGAIGFLLAAVYFRILAGPSDWVYSLFFIGVPVLVAVLFFFGWLLKRNARAD
jgi:hypothetical protein